MKNLSFKLGIIVVFIASSLMFVSCEKDDENSADSAMSVTKIKASNVIYSSSKIDNIKVEFFWEEDYLNSGWETVFGAKYNRDGFTLLLPSVMDDRYLEPILGNSDEYLEGVTISDKTVRFTDFDTFLAYNEKDSLIGKIYCSASDHLGDVDNHHTMSWIYVDKDLELNGENIDVSSDENEEFPEDNHYSEYKKVFDNVKLKKGWNSYYSEFIFDADSINKKYFHTQKMSTTKTIGINFNWYYQEY